MPRELSQIYNSLARGDLLRADALCQQALRENPFDAPVIDVLGVIARGRGDVVKATAHFKNAVAIAPEMPLYRCHLAMSLKALGQHEEARTNFEQALEIDPNSFETAYNYALALSDMGNAEGALAMAQRSVSLDPKSPQARNNLGRCYDLLGRHEAAAAEYRRAIKLNPDHAGAHANLGYSLTESDRLGEASSLIDRVLKRWPNDVDILNAKLNLLERHNALDSALVTADRILAIKADFAQAHYAKGMILMTLGRLAEGWPEYEWRVKRQAFAPRRSYKQPRWSGEPLAGKTLLVHWEQGFGDVIQFCRYLPMLRALCADNPDHAGARILFDCPKKLIGLLEGMNAWDEIGDFGDDPPPFDVFIPLMSLAPILGVGSTGIPNTIPYLSPGPADDIALDDVPAGTLKVGLTWASDHGDSYRRKVMAAGDLAPLFAIPGCRFYGLQFGREGRDLDPYVGPNVANFGNVLGDFSHTAGIVAKLDLIIAIDTYVVHLAGAIGKTAWVMLPFSPDWRWGLERNDSPWYPGMRLFRQPKPGDWKSVVADVGRALVHCRTG